MMPDQPLIQISEDGSHTLKSKKFEVTYHSIHGAITESNVVFIDAGLAYSALNKPTRISVFEMGFGSGLNALLSFMWATNNNVNLQYHTIEAFPVSVTTAEQLNYPNILGNDDIFRKLHTCPWNTEITLSSDFIFTKYLLDAETAVIPHLYNVIFFDAFSPATQPNLWETPFLKKMFDLLLPNGILVSYCAQGAFKRNLRSVGFRVESLPGPPGKREMTRAVKFMA